MKKNCFCDAHIHLSHCSLPVNLTDYEYMCCSSCFTREEFITLENRPSGILLSYGIHPQNPDMKEAEYLETLAREKKIHAVGECGYDLFTQDFRSKLDEQERAFDFQLECAHTYSLPLVIHSRKAADLLFKKIRELKKIKAVVFHSYGGTMTEALSFLKKGVNAYFSFGKPLLNGKKSALECASKIDITRLLLETDAPYQTLKDETQTYPEQIIDVYKKACELREVPEEDFMNQIRDNFTRAFLSQ